MKLHVTKLHVTKLHITIGAMVAALIGALVCSACESTFVEQITPEAELLSLEIGDIVIEWDNKELKVTPQVGEPKVIELIENNPNIENNGSKKECVEPIPNRDWLDEEYDLGKRDFYTIRFNEGTELVNARFVPTFSKGAKVKWGVASRTVRPGNFEDTRVFATFSPGDFIYFQVISEDGETINYYRFATYLSRPVKELSSIKVATREGDMNSVVPDETWNGDLLTISSLHLTGSEAAPATVIAVPFDSEAKLQYAVTNYAADVKDRTEPVFGSNETLFFRDGQLLYVKVAAENTIDINIYCFRVYVGRIATIGKLTFINPARETAEEGTGTFEALGKGTAKNRWSDNSGAGSFDSPHQPQAGFTFAVDLDDTGGKWQYATISSLPANDTEPTWSASFGSGDAIPDTRLENGQYLAVKVLPPNPQGSRPNYFYKVKIGLLAAEFTVQPKSNVYLKDAAADPLTFTLDRPINNATYQWYEANSWYGGYGFDSAGRIGQRGPLVAEAGWGSDDKGTINGIDYDVSAWHKIDLDEKDNVSLHNGGNNYYNLPTPGRPIPATDGGTDQTYIPKTDYRPFITNFSNESHYYWVEVTDQDTGLKAVSARAVVVTEWGVQYHNGHPTDVTVDKKHYIIDLYAYQTPGVSYGLQTAPRNPTPFIDGNHRDSYWIPVTFPSGFDIFDYSVFTAQALFFLADGREWIQNWTQGDIGFGRTKEGGTKGNLNDAEEIVLWYNLTNDNATRGLASSGNEPQGSGLSEIPEYIVVKPAGTKPLNRMPPFQDGLEGRPLSVDSVGRYNPQNIGDAQGWFTPYIELSELRFEGPAREKPKD